MLYVHCGFIAHYSIHGFREYYQGLGFREFVEHFDRLHPNRDPWLGQNSEYAELINDMAAYVTSQASNIYAELEDRQRNSEIALARKLLMKHGVSLSGEDKETVVQESLFEFPWKRMGRWRLGFNRLVELCGAWIGMSVGSNSCNQKAN